MSSKKKRAAIDLSLELEKGEDDRSSGGNSDGDDCSKDGKMDKEEGQLKKHREAIKEESNEKVVEVVVDQGEKGSNQKEIKFRTQPGEEMEEDKQLAEEGDGGGESNGAETRAEDKHVVEEAGNSNGGDDNHSVMEQNDEVRTRAFN
jgi:hypothetical protein